MAPEQTLYFLTKLMQASSTANRISCVLYTACPQSGQQAFPRPQPKVRTKSPFYMVMREKSLNNLELGPSIQKKAHHRGGICYLEMQSYPTMCF